MNGILLEQLGFLGLTGTSNDIINGIFACPENALPFAGEFFQQFKFDNHTSSPPPNKKMRETISAASISGIHFGHLKASSLNLSLSEFEAAIANVTYSTGYQPIQWKESIICIIKKRANADLVTKLRMIILTEADFNFNNKKLGCREQPVSQRTI